ncbi:hypothetical protein IAU59_003179 [Kwoniella sp. CBS 9459]
MDIFAGSVDLAFILLALLLIHRHPVPSPDQGSAPKPSSGSAPGAVPSPRPPSSPSSHTNSPSPSPRADGHGMLDVPSITVTSSEHQQQQQQKFNHQLAVPMPMRPALPGAGGAKGRHKKKSVSFSLSSMDDFLPPSPGGGDGGLIKRRPPTPFMRLPRSPSEFTPIHSPTVSPVPTPSILNNRYDNAFNARVKPARPMIDTQIDLDSAGMPSPEETRAEMRHSPNAEDPMGVRKQWLMA